MARPIDPDARRHPIACRANDATRAWLELWRPGGIAADQLTDVLERAMKFWPDGPDKFRQLDPDAPRKERLSAAVSRAAARRGMEKAAYINAACAAFEAAEKIEAREKEESK